MEEITRCGICGLPTGKNNEDEEIIDSILLEPICDDCSRELDSM